MSFTIEISRHIIKKLHARQSSQFITCKLSSLCVCVFVHNICNDFIMSPRDQIGYRAHCTYHNGYDLVPLHRRCRCVA